MSEQNFIEAPASWNTKYISPDGFICQLTLRGESGKELLEKAQAALIWLNGQGCRPAGWRQSDTEIGKEGASQPMSTPTLPDGTPDPAWCPIHGVAMKRREKDGQVWYSHKAGDGWCRGKANGKEKGKDATT